MLNDVLIPLDQDLLLLLNGSRSVYFDRLIDQLTTASTWIPLYVALLLMVVKNNYSLKLKGQDVETQLMNGDFTRVVSLGEVSQQSALVYAQ